MHRLAIFLTVLLILGAAFSCSPPKYKEFICGKWTGRYEGQDLLFSFNMDKTCELRFEDKKTKAVTIYMGKYIIDLSKTPVAMTIRNIQRLDHNLYTIIWFENKDAFLIAPFAPISRFRSVSFRDAIPFRRVNEKILERINHDNKFSKIYD